ncbi:hypothetical protein KR032_012086 [Drosophila birchii]|nr:hypothetical protein KR032_012086 [Drosophila birchii]
MMAMSLAVRECQPRISNYPVPPLQLDASTTASKEMDSSILCLRSPLPMDSNDDLGRKQIRCNFLYRNQFHSSFSDAGCEVFTSSSDEATSTMKNDTEAEADAVTLTTSRSRQNVSPEEEQQVQQEEQEQQKFSSFIRPKAVPDTKCSSFLRVLARSLETCSVRIAAGFGLSRQQTAWYKHCWHTPGSQSQRIHNLACHSRSIITLPSPTSMATIPRNLLSSTTL